MGKKIFVWIYAAFLTLFFVFLFTLLFGWITMLLWNWVVVSIFHVQPISFWLAVGVYWVLFSIGGLFKAAVTIGNKGRS